MAEWALKRFWREAGVGEAEGGFTVLLDGRPIRTPLKATLTMPSRALARAAADEWDAQTDMVRPQTMPLTRLANSAIDTVGARSEEVAAIIAAFGETDLLCYRAEALAELAGLQAEAWDPMLDWADAEYNARLRTTTGILPISQDVEAIAALGRAVRALPPFELAALHELVSLSGSLVLGLATAAGTRPAETIWTMSRIDEDWQIAQWGRDDEAEAVAELKRDAFLTAHRFLTLSRAIPS